MRDRAKALLAFLNEQAGTTYEPMPHFVTPIVSLLNEAAKYGFASEAIDEHARFVIIRRVELWKDDPKFCSNLTPSTIFHYANFWKYHGELGLPGPGKVATG